MNHSFFGKFLESIWLAIELLAACQAIDLRRPFKSTPILEAVHAHVRSHVTFMDKDRYLAEDISIVTKLITKGTIWELVKTHIETFEE